LKKKVTHFSSKVRKQPLTTRIIEKGIMDLDWCLICEQKTLGTLYCSEECRFKDYLSAYSGYLTPPASPTSATTGQTSTGTSTPTNGFDFNRRQLSIGRRCDMRVFNRTNDTNVRFPLSPTDSPINRVETGPSGTINKHGNSSDQNVAASAPGVTLQTSKSSSNLIQFLDNNRQRV
jgi:hypothetical protein